MIRRIAVHGALLAALAGCVADPTTPPAGATVREPTVPVGGGVTPPRVNLTVEMRIAACPCPSTGGRVSVLRTDSAGQEAVTLDLVRTGQAFLAYRHFPSGTYRLTYEPPPGFRVAAEGTNPVVTVLGDALQAIVFDVAQDVSAR